MMANRSSQLILGSVYHDDLERRKSQERVTGEVRRALKHAGNIVVEVHSCYQPALMSDRPPVFRFVQALRHSWQQDIFNLQEARRRRGESGQLSMRKTLRALSRLLLLSLRVREHSGILKRRHIEGALSEKHIHIWRTLVNSEALGAVILEDDVVMSSPKGATRLADLVSKYMSYADFIDLAGGFSRSELGFPGPETVDLELDYMLANTTAGYFIGRNAAIALVDYLYLRPQAKYLGSDFLIGLLNEIGFTGKTIIPASLPLRHGSMHGDFEGLIPY